jgi:hypothetical protein
MNIKWLAQKLIENPPTRRFKVTGDMLSRANQGVTKSQIVLD